MVTPVSPGNQRPSLLPHIVGRQDPSWTDDLPVCDVSDVGVRGLAPNVGCHDDSILYQNRVFNFALVLLFYVVLNFISKKYFIRSLSI